MKQTGYISGLFFFLFCFLPFFTYGKQSQQTTGDDPLARIITFPKIQKTTYKLLEMVSEQSGFLFIYDNRMIDNERKVRLPKGNYTIRQAIYRITGNDRLQLQIIGGHILITAPRSTAVSPPTPQTEHAAQRDSFFIVEGRMLDRLSHEPIEAGVIGVKNHSIGSISNANGEFRLILPDSLRNEMLYFSHIGYESEHLPAEVLAQRHSSIPLNPKVFPIQEVIVRIQNPIRLLREMNEKIEANYPLSPVYMTTFYREGVESRKRFVNMTEALFKIYKTGYMRAHESDQVKLLKMRKITNNQEKDTIITKMKSGINACIQLDLVKNRTDFLFPDPEKQLYLYTSADITTIDDRIVHVIFFEQREDINDPLYQGELYIDPETKALLKARFELHPKYIARATGMLVEKKSRNLQITPQKVTYSVSYKQWNGRYYINHIRGDLYFKIKKKKQLFGHTPVHTWFEMVTSKVEDDRLATKFARPERLSTQTVFSDTRYVYDASFWDDFNFIPPEEQLFEAIGRISTKIEESGR